MIEISFKNAEVCEQGFGLKVNGEDLEDIIRVVLGVEKYGSDSKTFESNSCDITITIDPHPSVTNILKNGKLYHSTGELIYDEAIEEAVEEAKAKEEE